MDDDTSLVAQCQDLMPETFPLRAIKHAAFSVSFAAGLAPNAHSS
jgi:hypothetical protein